MYKKKDLKQKIGIGKGSLNYFLSSHFAARMTDISPVYFYSWAIQYTQSHLFLAVSVVKQACMVGRRINISGEIMQEIKDFLILIPVLVFYTFKVSTLYSS